MHAGAGETAWCAVGWQANELARPLARLKAMDNNGLLRRTLQAWFRHNVIQPAGDVCAHQLVY